MTKISAHKGKVFLVFGGLALLMMFAFGVRSSAAQAETVWAASFYNNTNLSGLPAYERKETAVPNHNWGFSSPVPGVVADDNFSARWTAPPTFEPGNYRFSVRADDGVRLWVDGRLVIDEWRQQPATTFSAEVSLPHGGPAPVVFEYYEKSGGAQVSLNWEKITSTSGPIRAEYFNNRTLSGQPDLTRFEDAVNHQWGEGSPAPGIINNDDFSARYTQTLNLLPGQYRFTVAADDGVRLWLNNEVVLDAWRDGPADQMVFERDLPGGLTTLMTEYYENAGQALIVMNWSRLDAPEFIIPGLGGGGGGSITPPPFPTPPATTGQTASVNTNYLNMRAGPGMEYDVIMVLSRGTVVELTGQQNSYWVFIKAPDGRLGWVSRRYLDYHSGGIPGAVG